MFSEVNDLIFDPVADLIALAIADDAFKYCRNNVNSPIRTSAIGLLQHLQLLYLPS
jgi:hypothetical protein